MPGSFCCDSPPAVDSYRARGVCSLPLAMRRRAASAIADKRGKFSRVHPCRVESDALQQRLSAMPHVRQFARLLLAVSSLTLNCAALAEEPKQVAAVFKLREVQFVYRTVVN